MVLFRFLGNGVGLGIIVGEPTGVSAKLWLDGNAGVDAAAAWSVYKYTALHVHADFLWHSLDLLKVSPGQLPLDLLPKTGFNMNGAIRREIVPPVDSTRRQLRKYLATAWLPFPIRPVLPRLQHRMVYCFCFQPRMHWQNP